MEGVSSVDCSEERRLTDMFDEGLTNYEQIINCTDSPSSSQLQNKIKKTIKLLEDTTKLINVAGVFSTNEIFAEIPTENIKYLLIPAFLGNLVTKLQSEDRVALLNASEVYYKDFLTRLQDYEVIPKFKLSQSENEVSREQSSRGIDLEQMARERNEKLRKYKEHKELEAELSRLKKALENEDEEITRKYFETYLKFLVSDALDELKSIKMELPLANRALEQKKNGKKNENLNEPFQAFPLKPIIITKNEVQKAVFGAGYPSLPTMTVDEFYHQRVAEGIFPAEGSKYNKTLQDLSDPDVARGNEEKEKIKKEMEVETDDPEALEKARNFDEYKDEHRRGWGNRMNRS